MKCEKCGSTNLKYHGSMAGVEYGHCLDCGKDYYLDLDEEEEATEEVEEGPANKAP